MGEAQISPVLVPRLDSYRLMRGLGRPPSNPSRSGSGSEICERLPDSGSLGDDIDDQSFDDRLRLSGSDEAADSDEAYLDSVENNKRRNQHQSGGREGGEHLVKPSQIKNKKKQPGRHCSSAFKYNVSYGLYLNTDFC